MKKTLSVLSLVTAALLLTGCAAGPTPTGLGLITNVKGPIMATDQTGDKKGQSCAISVLGLYNNGDASIESAKAEGKIRKVVSVDYHTEGFYPFYGKTCTLVTGL
ncbi:TRL-like family protein [Pantoea sp. A4]|uniref:TRL-like family protein n=1 Tax=Pantoea sp. A4 TaxID=1225184 RepID=UPI00035F3129|nr:TRL-like family protein [Pantoea sp. A4]